MCWAGDDVFLSESGAREKSVGEDEVELIIGVEEEAVTIVGEDAIEPVNGEDEAEKVVREVTAFRGSLFSEVAVDVLVGASWACKRSDNILWPQTKSYQRGGRRFCSCSYSLGQCEF